MLALLAWILPADELGAALRRIEPAAWAAAFAAFAAVHAMAAAKWRLLLRAAGAVVPYREAARGHAYGLFGNLFLPSIVGGDVVRAGVLLRGRPRAPVLLGSFVDRALDLLSLVTLAALGALAAPSALDTGSRTVFRGVVALAAVGVVALAATVLLLPARRFPFRFRRPLAHARAAVRRLARRPGSVAAAALLSLAGQAALVTLNAELGRRVGVEAPFSVWLLVWPLAKLAALLPVTQAGIGVREAALAALFRPFGVGAVEAVAASLALQTVLIGGGLAAGGVAWALGHRPNRAHAGREGSGASTRARAK
jgi:uncharacterized membrane protein YbhN (UPF0104 family)